MAPKNAISRRTFVESAGSLVIGFSLADSAIAAQVLAGSPQATIPASNARLDAWLRVEPDGMVRILTGKIDVGLGVETALAQVVAEELDVALDRIAFVMGDTSVSPDQSGVGASSSISQGARPLRNVAASARALLLQLASKRLNAAVDQLQVRSGIVSVKSDPSKSISYGDLVGSTELNESLKVSGTGFALNVQGSGKPKDPSSYTVVGKSVQRADLAAKIMGRFQYVTDVRVPDMLHGRVIRPTGVGAG
jgi:CO/xanthine dehydrogenase Mo-binding subunit